MLKSRVAAINDFVAEKATLAFGSMWTTYLFAIYGALGAIFVEWQAGLMYWSNWVQLWSLPLLMVGAVVVNRREAERTRKEAKETHDAVLEELQIIKDHFGIEAPSDGSK